MPNHVKLKRADGKNVGHRYRDEKTGAHRPQNVVANDGLGVLVALGMNVVFHKTIFNEFSGPVGRFALNVQLLLFAHKNACTLLGYLLLFDYAGTNADENKYKNRLFGEEYERNGPFTQLLLIK